MRLLLVRHGLTAWNAALRYQGWADTPLNAQGRQQACLLARRLRAEPLAGVYSSDLTRALETAQAIAAPHGLPVITLPELREASFGHWEGLTFEEVTRRDPKLAEGWIADPAHTAPPDGETLREVGERMQQALREMEAAVAGGTAVAVTHGGAIQALLCRSLGLALRRHWQFQVEPASITLLDTHPEGTILARLNDTSHLAGASALPQPP